RFAKSRLAGVLDRAERMALQDAMLADVLSTLTEVGGLEGIAVCSPDRSHAQMAERHGAAFLEQPQNVPDLNSAAAHGVAMLARRGGEGRHRGVRPRGIWARVQIRPGSRSPASGWRHAGGGGTDAAQRVCEGYRHAGRL